MERGAIPSLGVPVAGALVMSEATVAADSSTADAMAAGIGGTTTVDKTVTGKPVVELDLHGPAVADADLPLPAGLTEPRHFDHHGGWARRLAGANPDLRFNEM